MLSVPLTNFGLRSDVLLSYLRIVDAIRFGIAVRIMLNISILTWSDAT